MARTLADKYAALEKVVPKFADRMFTHDSAVAFCRELCGIAVPSLKILEPASASALLYSIRHMEGRALSSDLIRRNGQRVLANWAFIREGMVIPEWDGSNIDADVVVLGIGKPKVTPSKRIVYDVVFHLKNGLGAGIISCATLYDSAISLFLDKFSGCRKYACPPEEISGMKARILVSRENRKLKVHSWGSTESQKVYNRSLCEARINPRKCRSGMPCNVCLKTVDQCPLAVWIEEKNNGK